MIEISSLHKKIGYKTILKGINLKIPEGKLICLIGPNGAGKSSLLSLIAQLEKVEKGVIELDNRDIRSYRLAEFSMKLAYLQQHNHLDLKLTVAELVAYGRFPYSKGRLTANDHQIIEQTIGELNLKSLRNSFIDELSGGERQRVFLAMILAQDTPYILLDEPLNNLDMKHAVEIMQHCKNLVCTQGKTILIVVHDINFAANYADYIVGMKDGNLAFMLPTSQAIQADVLGKLFNIDFQIITSGVTVMCNYYFGKSRL
ncbi:ATP-binding cassette domain-containing protein [Sphingobacteriaceae bacterium WQ 2009]|uniref:ATP-binding cassette domain-containing protein n=1 Tax=Rhinopithecimicrobium faecis TaxID=2820698 RepID=A0A8T4HB33_9SPHI|nr:ATP-binding cassette domain-containing protein [Sphingobacteriaceae bacterium WQ 2009]